MDEPTEKQALEIEKTIKEILEEMIGIITKWNPSPEVLAGIMVAVSYVLVAIACTVSNNDTNKAIELLGTTISKAMARRKIISGEMEEMKPDEKKKEGT